MILKTDILKDLKEGDEEEEHESDIDEETGDLQRIFIVNPSDAGEVEETLEKIANQTRSVKRAELLCDPKKDPHERLEMVNIEDGQLHLEKNTDLDDHDRTVRVRMESCILAAFKHNMNLGPTGLLNKFVHVISTDRLQQLIAQEFLENDMLKMFDTESMFIRITIWQIVTSLFAIMVT